MICYTEHNHPAFGAIAGHPCLAAMIGCMAACGEPRDDFWLLRAEDNSVGAFLCRTGDCLYVTGTPAHSEEISAFIDLMGFGCVETDLPLGPEGMKKTVNASLQWQGLPGRAIVGDGILVSTKLREEVPLVELAGLLHRVGLLPDGEMVGEMAVTLLHRIRADRAIALMLREDKAVGAVAAVTHIGCGNAMIGGVAVAPEYRGEGLGTRIVTVAAALAEALGLVPLLACNERRVSFYIQAGFTPILPFYRYERIT